MSKTKAQNDLIDVGQELILGGNDGADLFFDGDGNLTTQQPDEKVITGDQAMVYMLGKTRPNQLLVMFDHRIIAKRFKSLIDDYISRGEDPREMFWRNLTIRVWKVANIGKKTVSLTLKTGKDADGNGVYTDHKGAVYTGDIFDGRALEGFLPNIPHSARHNEFRVQLVSVKVTEDMQRVHNSP